MQRTRNWTMILAFPLILVAITTCQLAITGDAMALFYNQNVTNAVIFGSGNNNGSFTVDRASGVELGLRGKLRFDENGYPQNVFNSNGDGTYTFSIGAAPGGASWVTSTTPIWSFEWSINSNYDGNGQFLNGFTYVLGIDFDPGIGITNWLTFDPINGYPYVNDRLNGATHDRRNEASKKRQKSGLGQLFKSGFFTSFLRCDFLRSLTVCFG